MGVARISTIAVAMMFVTSAFIVCSVRALLGG